MDWQTLIIQLGISGATLFVLREYLQRTDKRIDERDKTFISFVNENNHKVTELVKESTVALKESSESIKQSTQVIKDLHKRICDKN